MKKTLYQNNEILLLERILEKDDEIKNLRNKLDVIQTEKINAHSCKQSL